MSLVDFTTQPVKFTPLRSHPNYIHCDVCKKLVKNWVTCFHCLKKSCPACAMNHCYRYCPVIEMENHPIEPKWYG